MRELFNGLRGSYHSRKILKFSDIDPDSDDEDDECLRTSLIRIDPDITKPMVIDFKVRHLAPNQK